MIEERDIEKAIKADVERAFGKKTGAAEITAREHVFLKSTAKFVMEYVDSQTEKLSAEIAELRELVNALKAGRSK